MECKCELCERDKKYIPNIVKEVSYGVGDPGGEVVYVSTDRLAVLIKDHCDIQKLRVFVNSVEYAASGMSCTWDDNPDCICGVCLIKKAIAILNEKEK